MKLTNERASQKQPWREYSLIAVNLINKYEVANHPNKMPIEDCKNLKEAMHLDLLHVHREINKCANYMSKLGRVQGEKTIRVVVPPNDLVQLLKADMEIVAYPI